MLKLLRAAPGMQALYLSHYSVNGAAENPPEEFIANIVQDWKDSADGKWLKVSVDKECQHHRHQRPHQRFQDLQEMNRWRICSVLPISPWSPLLAMTTTAEIFCAVYRSS